ncbi:MAG: GNAT family N-acetyltransferase [Acidimicrobiales bacterium]
MIVETPREVSVPLRQVFDVAVAAARASRGGDELLTALLPPGDDPLVALVAAGSVRVAVSDGAVIGVAVVAHGVLGALYVAPEHRRHGAGREFATTLFNAPDGPRDGWALPGDRATKSLYESMGMKARLLTMRAE